MKKALIVGGGPVLKELLEKELAKKPDLVIGVDGGSSYLYESGDTPQIVIGDLDSLSPGILDKLVQAGVEILRFSPQKDETDMELALDYTIGKAFRSIMILGGLGRRLDHTLANIGLLLKGLNQGVEVWLQDETHLITSVNSRIILQKIPGWAVSLVPLTPKVSGVTTSGLVYPLNNADLFFEKSRGIHNEFAAEVATVEVKEGFLLVVLFQLEFGK